MTRRRLGVKAIAAVVLETDGRTSEVDPSLMPFSPWNAELLRKTMVVSTNDGSITPLSVTDHGEEQLVLHGHATRTHHYSIKTSFPQDVWYDQQRRLVRAGERVRVYIPYGQEWYGYLMRRLAERPQNLSFFVRSLISKK